MLTGQQQAILVVSSLDDLPHKDDLMTGKVVHGCCPVCCARCDVLGELYDSRRLNPLVRQAPEHQWRNSYWWDGDGVDPEHLMTAWYWNRCQHHDDRL